MRSLAAFVILLCSVIGACGPNVSVTRTGERFDAFDEACPLDFVYGDINKAMQLSSNGYVQVGSITVVKGGDSFDDAMKARVRPEACKLGGHVVMMGASSPGSFTTNYSYVSLMVFRKTQASSESPPSTAPGTKL